MRFPTVAAAVYLGLLAWSAVFAADPPPPAGAMPAATAAPAAPGDAAAKHAKRTACLKEAKTRKLVGAAKTSFIKNCIAAP